jgi:RNA polymerase sigma-70 factor (ECF subfamily)
VKLPTDDDARGAFEQLYRETRADLLAYALRRSLTAEDAADVVAETYLIAWRRLERVPTGDQARLWLFGVARNLLRKGVGRRHFGDRLVERLARELRAGALVHPPGENECLEAVRRALARLSARDREILTLTAWEGLTPKQIAAVTGMSANIVRVRLHRARNRLKRQLDRPRPPARLADGIAVERD